MSELFVPMYSDGSFAVGGGSSTASHVRAFEEKISAERSAARLPISHYQYNRETGKYEIHEYGSPKVHRFISDDAIDTAKVRINNILVMYAVEPALYREIAALLDEEL